MKKSNVIVWVVITIAALLLIYAMETNSDPFAVLKKFIPTVEGFRSKPYWDNKQWSWGYGTKVPGSINNRNVAPNKTITRQQAFDEMITDLNYRFAYLKKLIKRKLNANNWASLLSFAYNEGLGAATNLIPEIEAGDMAALEQNMKLYKYYTNAAGQKVVSSDLIDRRAKEFQLYIS